MNRGSISGFGVMVPVALDTADAFHRQKVFAPITTLIYPVQLFALTWVACLATRFCFAFLLLGAKSDGPIFGRRWALLPELSSVHSIEVLH